jgi:hypothetical protein
MEKWFGFYAFNSQTAYGYGTYDEADSYCDFLNRDREINVYHFEEIKDDETLDDLNNDRDDGFSLDIALSDIAEYETE